MVVRTEPSGFIFFFFSLIMNDIISGNTAPTKLAKVKKPSRINYISHRRIKVMRINCAKGLLPIG